MGGALLSLVSFIVAIGVLVTVHEFGHFWVARRLGVRVLRFSVGFGRPLWRREGRDGTEYVIAAIPLGGYVKMLDEREGVVPPAECERAFNRKGVWARMAIVAAGPAFNFAFAVLAYWAVFSMGVPGLRPVVGEVVPATPASVAGFRAGDEIVRVDGEPTPSWELAAFALLEAAAGRRTVEVEVRTQEGARAVRRLVLSDGAALAESGQLLARLGLRPWRPRLEPVVEAVAPDGPAARAGLRPGDRVLAVDDAPIADWDAFVRIVRASPGRALRVRLSRDGHELTLRLVPQARETPEGRVGHIGARVRVPDGLLERQRVVVRYGPLQALVEGAARTWDMTTLTLHMMWRMLTGEASVRHLSGPISIAQYAGETASLGLVSFLSFLAVISVSLGVINLLPIPLLDGGHLLYYAVEAVRGKALSDEAQALGQRIGIALIALLMGLAIYNDLARLLG